MSNPLSVRRVMVVTIDEKGKPDGPPSYGVMATDNYEQAYNDTFESLGQLNSAIEEAGCILDIAAVEGEFEGADREKIGTRNFYGDG